MRFGALTIALSLLSGPLLADSPRPDVRSPIPGLRGPGVRVWTSSGDLFRRNERVRVYYRTERDAFVSILRVDTDGRVRVLFPRTPMDDGWTPAGVTHTVSNWDRGVAFVVDDYPGVGYIFAIASSEPFDYRPIHAGDQWDLRSISDGRIHGDPRSSLEELMIGLLPREYEDFDTHIIGYHVERRYDYPRFVCYDCHTYTPFLAWNPYHSYCRSYTLVVWNDPWYYYPSYWYPTRYYGGRRVVYSYPRTSPRYVFKERDTRNVGIEYRRREQPAPVASSGGGVSGRRIDDRERGVRGIDLGGVGRVPAPRSVGDRRMGGEGRDAREGGDGREGGLRDVQRPEPRAGEQRPDSRGTDRGQQPAPSSDSRRRGGEPGIEIVPSQPREIERPGRQVEPTVIRPDRGADRQQPAARPESSRPESSRPESRPEAPRPDRGSERPQPQARPEAPRARPEAARPSAPQSRPESRPQPAPRSDPPSRGSSSSGSGGGRRRP